MPNCDNCSEKCPQAELAHNAALGRMYATKEFVNLVKKIESGQLVEVVRCRDCIKDGLTTCPLCWIENHTLEFVNHDPDFYCGAGERKDSDDNGIHKCSKKP